MTTVTAIDLRRMIKQVTPHMSLDLTLPAINAVRLECTPEHLLVIATDRYTMGVARVPIAEGGDWTAHIPGSELAAVTAWVRAATGTVSVTGEMTTKGSYLALSSETSQLTVSGDRISTYPNWRKFYRDALAAEPQLVPLTGFTSRFLSRWTEADEVLHAWQQSPNESFVFMSRSGDFLGMQMPVRNDQDTRASLAAPWLRCLTPLAYVDGQSYRLDIEWSDKDGDPWEYTGSDRRGEPLMRIVGIDDDVYTLAEVIEGFGPISPIVTAREDDN